ncbi:uncharacterized protein BCR38DRAFT_334985, partial [Pseudomassariella vexata]
KDILILMAAWEANIDRYYRFRRPTMLPEEVCCVKRGIYYHTTFAKWWCSELDDNAEAEDWSRYQKMDPLYLI